MLRINVRGSALIVTIMIMVIMTLIGVYMFEKVAPVMRNSTNIENSTVSYYQARSGVELALLTMTGSNPSYSSSTNAINPATQKGYAVDIVGSGQTIPMPGEGTSEYDQDWDRLSVTEPVQVSIDSTSINWNNVQIHLRVPNIAQSSVTTLTGGSMMIVGWSLDGSGQVINGATSV